MPLVDLDRQAIERRDFPIGRRGYDPAAVDAHLRELSAEVEGLQRSAASGGDMSLASSAGSQVQSILEAAETAAGEIERQALENARQVREAADRDAEQTRAEAVEKARAHVAGVANVAATLLERVGSMDGEVTALVESLRSGASRLASDLSAVESGMGELYDAASGRNLIAAEEVQLPQAQPQPQRMFEAELSDALIAEQAPVQLTVPVEQAELAPVAGGNAADLDGARLIALNMALNGESRSDTERYLAENFQLPDRLKLIDEVYAAIEG
jgi:DivIVA domain-containing protein